MFGDARRTDAASHRTVAAPFPVLRLMLDHGRIRVRQHRQSERRGGHRARARALLSGAQALPDHRDLAGSDSIEVPHLAEALQYRPQLGCVDAGDLQPRPHALSPLGL